MIPIYLLSPFKQKMPGADYNHKHLAGINSEQVILMDIQAGKTEQIPGGNNQCEMSIFFFSFWQNEK